MSTEQIGKYEIVETLGKGSMGVVYKGRDPEIGRLVAIKTLKSVFLGDDELGNEALQRFRQESRSAGKLNHNNIVGIYEAGKTVDGSPYIVMEYKEGPSLEKLIAEKGQIEPLEVLHYLAQLADAIDYAHSQQVIHRDIKPSNLIVDQSHVVHLLDFGVAKLTDTSLTPAGTVVGTPSYMSPEQIRGEKLDGRTDVFSIAVMAYEMFTGVRPFPGNDFTTVVSNIVHKDPLSFKELGVTLPSDLEKVLAKGLAKDREQRYASNRSFVADIARVLGVGVNQHGLSGGLQPGAKWTRQVTSNNELTKVNRSAQSTATPSQVVSPGSSRALVFLVMGVTLITGLAVGSFLYKDTLFASSGVEEKEVQTSEVQETTEVASQVVEPVQEETKNEKAEIDIVVPSVDPAAMDSAQLSLLKDGELAYFLSSPDSTPELLGLVLNEVAQRDNGLFLPYVIRQSTHSNFKVRVSAIKTLSAAKYLSTNEGFAAIVARLSDDEFLVRGFSARALASAGGERVREQFELRKSIETNPVVKKIIEDFLKQN